MVMIAEVDKIYAVNADQGNDIKDKYDPAYYDEKVRVRGVSLIQPVQGDGTHKGGDDKDCPGFEYLPE